MVFVKLLPSQYDLGMEMLVELMSRIYRSIDPQWRALGI